MVFNGFVRQINETINGGPVICPDTLTSIHNNHNIAWDSNYQHVYTYFPMISRMKSYINYYVIIIHSCGKVMFLHVPVILSTGVGVWQTPPPPLGRPLWADTPLGRHTPTGRHTPRQTPPPLGRYPLGRHPLWEDTPLPPAMATAADGMHPTGMHFSFPCRHCILYNFQL